MSVTFSIGWASYSSVVIACTHIGSSGAGIERIRSTASRRRASDT
jgi:hypothetical protein